MSTPAAPQCRNIIAFFFCLLGIMMISRQWYEQKTRSLFLLKSTNILALISRYSFVFPVIGQTVQFRSCGMAACSTPGHGQQRAAACVRGWSPLPSAGLLQAQWHMASFCICLCVFHHLRLCSFSLNFLSWYENASFVFLSSFSSAVCGPARRAAGRSRAERGQRCRRAGSPA